MKTKDNKETFKAIFEACKNLTEYKIRYGIFNNERAEVLRKHTQLKNDPARHLPKRDIMVQPVMLDKKIVYDALSKYLKNTNLTKKHAMFPVLNAFGRFIIDNVVKHFVEQNGRGYLAPLSPRTIKKKGHDLILRDTFKMYNALDSQVVPNKKN